MTFDEYGEPSGLHWDSFLYKSLVTHFSMWALLKSPMILGHDLLNTVRFVSQVESITSGISISFVPSSPTRLGPSSRTLRSLQ